jgi:hypothetical protein
MYMHRIVPVNENETFANLPKAAMEYFSTIHEACTGAFAVRLRGLLLVSTCNSNCRGIELLFLLLIGANPIAES